MSSGKVALWSLLLLAACSGNPIATGDGDGDGDGDTDNAIPTELAGNVRSVNYDPEAETLTVEVWALDASPVVATYTRNPALDVPGYQGFSVQDDPLDRMFVALAAASPDGSVQAGVVSDGGQFNTYFAGGFYARNSGSVPTTGLVSYAGRYAGISNLNASGANLLPGAPAGLPADAYPGEPARTSGKAFMNVDFDDGAVNGTIYDRQFVESGAALADITLTPAALDANGEFLGDVEFSGMPDEGTQGSYGGIIGGQAGSSMAGVISLTNIFLPDDPREDITEDFDAEVGVFVLPRCGTTGAPAICDSVNP